MEHSQDTQGNEVASQSLTLPESRPERTRWRARVTDDQLEVIEAAIAAARQRLADGRGKPLAEVSNGDALGAICLAYLTN